MRAEARSCRLHASSWRGLHIRAALWQQEQPQPQPQLQEDEERINGDGSSRNKDATPIFMASASKVSPAHEFKKSGASQQRDIFSFSGCGWMLAYHIGVAHALVEAGRIQPHSRFAGASGGALVSALLACGLDPITSLDLFLEHAAWCNENGTWWRLKRHLTDMLQHSLPDDAHELCTGRITVALTRIWPRPRWRPILVREFPTREDLIQALVASCMVPGYLDSALVSRYRDMYVIDGGVLHLVPHIAGAIKVSPFRSFSLRSQRAIIDISPRLTPDFPFTDSQLWGLCFYPSDEHVTRDVFEWGRRAADVWLKASPRGLPLCAPEISVVHGP